MEALLLPARFLTTIAHVLLVIALLEANVKAALPDRCGGLTTDSRCRSVYNTQNARLVVGLSVSLALLVAEFVSLFAGVSMFCRPLNAFYTLCHGLAALLLALFGAGEWHPATFWWIFGFLTVPPPIMEGAQVLRIVVLNKLEY
eukprot:m51a1_g10991 hypothetical protein (144) ;mRNA; f:333034-333718